ncbi:PEP-CTERM sorting domain-containing protein [Oxalobacteraceae bacterium OTU3CINTB1]|nr:PEP-CTERM sorting domain-containing protein [Oxalobacteraceae bacterium OTU3CINTB1]
MTTTLPSHLKKNLVPLLLALSVSQAYAADIVYTGADGASGLIGATPGQHGGAGGAGVPLSAVLGQAQQSLTLTLYGGTGGTGGTGGVRSDTIFAGNGGAGGFGGAASGVIATSTSAALDTVVATLVYGGRGGSGGAPGGLAEMLDNGDIYGPFNPIYGATGIGGIGGAASSSASAVVGGAASVDVTALAVGGVGGSLEGPAGIFGGGGGASATAYGQSDTGKVRVRAEARGGDGGQPTAFLGSGVGVGADVEQINAVSGRTSGELTLIQRAVAGRTGPSWPADPSNPVPPDGVRSANARSALTLSDATAASVVAHVSAVGGDASLAMNFSYSGGAGSALLDLTSTAAGAAVDGTVEAFGGTGSVYVGGGEGGMADAVAVLTGLADVRGSVAAYGGSGGPTTFGGNGGAATASLTISAQGMARGSATATGGQTGAENNYYQPRIGQAGAFVVLAGAGAQGAATAVGSSAISRLTARTSGAQGVDVSASAHGYSDAGVVVESGVGPSAAGTASVRARVDASSDASSYSAATTAALDVTASGDIDGVSQARSGDALWGWYGSPPSAGNVTSSARGVTSGNHAVAIRAIARAGETGFLEGYPLMSAGASATAFGQSGGGVVDVSAEARASGGIKADLWNAYGAASASATAVNLARGGRGIARATAWGGDAQALATASGVGASGAIRVSGAAGPIAGDWPAIIQFSATSKASGANYYDAAGFQLAGHGGAGQVVVSNVSAGPDAVGDIAGLGPVVTAAVTSVAGVGMQAFSSDTAALGNDGGLPGPTRLTASGQFGFDGIAGQHLLLGFVSASFADGFDTLELSITNNGVGLFSRLFTSADDAMLFLNDKVLDLGLFGPGAQDVRVSSTYSYFQPGAFAFNYLVGTGAAVAPVPEPSSWLMLALGLGTLVLVARRRTTRRP